jgi:hypothetical protein
MSVKAIRFHFIESLLLHGAAFITAQIVVNDTTNGTRSRDFHFDFGNAKRLLLDWGVLV